MDSGQRPGGIFICYRREETVGIAGRLYDHLSDRFGAGRVFMDLDSIAIGVDFATAITEAVSGCDILLVLIGREWLSVTDARGIRRLDDSNDWIRVEIEAALQRGRPVVPVLVDGAVLPRANDLPPSLQPLIRRQALKLSHDAFRSEVSRLIAVVDEMLGAGPGRAAGAALDTDAPAATSGPPIGKAHADSPVDQDSQHQAKIFLCYRREDTGTQGFARGIHQSLVSKYGRDHVFRDIDSTPPGRRFSDWIETKVGQCDVMIVLIGDAWLRMEDKRKQRRLDLPNDWVRQEIHAAIKREIPIIPVLVQRAPMPSEDELPDSIAGLAGFQSTEVTDSRWDYDMGLLIQGIDNLIAPD